MISLYSVDGPTVNRLSRRLTDVGLHVTLSSSLRDIDIDRLRVQQLDGQALLYIEPRVRTGWRRMAMRIFDLVVALVGLVLTAPIVAGVALAIRIESSGPVFYRQRRVGLNGQVFDIIKLRTMYDGADQQRESCSTRTRATARCSRSAPIRGSLGRSGTAQVLDRRAPAVLERGPRRDECRGSSAGAAERGGPVDGRTSTSGCGCCPVSPACGRSPADPTRRSRSTSGSTCTTSTTGR